MATYKATKSEEKEQARQLVLSHCEGGNVLTLSADNFLFEEQLLAKLFSNFTLHEKTHKLVCYEYNKKMYKSGYPKFRELKEQYGNIRYRCNDIYTEDASKFDFIWLDLCGTLCTENILKMVSFLRDFNGKFFLTIERGREHPNFSNNCGGVGKTTRQKAKDFRDNIFADLICQWLNMQVIATQDYHSRSVDSSGSPMRLIGFQKKDLVN